MSPSCHSLVRLRYHHLVSCANAFMQLCREGSDGRATMLDGATAITANDPQEPSSYLTCLLGRPFDGLRCQIGSYMSVRKELVVEGSEVR